VNVLAIRDRTIMLIFDVIEFITLPH